MIMCKRGIIAMVLSGWLAVVGSWASAAPPARPAGDVQDLLFLGGTQSFLIRLHLQIGERPITAAWVDAVGRLHESFDFSAAGSTERELLADYFQVLDSPVVVRMQPSELEQDATFARVDADGDGTLAPLERRRAAEVLRRFDRNDDEALSSVELTAFRDPNSAASAANNPRGDTLPPILPLDRRESRIQTVRQVLNRLDGTASGGMGRTKDQRLSRAEVRLAPEVFRKFDANRDGALDSIEIMEFLDRGEPSVELIIRLGPRPSGRPALEIVDRPSPAPSSPARLRSRSDCGCGAARRLW